MSVIAVAFLMIGACTMLGLLALMGDYIALGTPAGKRRPTIYVVCIVADLLFPVAVIGTSIWAALLLFSGELG